MTKESMLEPLNRALDEYESEYRNPLLERFDRSDLYALFPKNKDSLVDVTLGWAKDEPWPNSNRTGVYVIFGKEHPLYVGLSDFIGGRLGNYFGYDPVGDCRINPKNKWIETPMYVVTVAVPETTPFEAYALERYLIRKLRPSHNSVGL